MFPPVFSRLRAATCLSGLLLAAGCASDAPPDTTASALAIEDAPRGFSHDASRRAALGPDAFVRAGSQLVTPGLVPGVAPRPLGAIVDTTFEQGFRLVPAASPEAFVVLRPQAGLAVASRLRQDGGLVAFDGAYSSVVSAALGATDRRVELSVYAPTLALAPRLRYQVTTGPAFGRWHTADGLLWAFDATDRAVLQLPVPTVRGSDGVTRTGSWLVDGDVLEAVLPLGEVVFPALSTLTWETPTWYPAGGAARPRARMDAAATFYGGDQNCLVHFGGYDVEGGQIVIHDDVAVRCDGVWLEDLTVAGETKPVARQAARLVFATIAGRPGAYLFGGFGPSGALDDLWRLRLSGSGSARTVTWEPIAKSGAWPPRRYEAGLAASGTDLLVFGGADAAGSPLTDTWRWNGSSFTALACSGASCFPKVRGFTTFTIGSKVFVFGGSFLVPGTPPTLGWSSEVRSFTNGAWKLESVKPARWPTHPDGTISLGGQILPTPREAAWSAGTVDGGALIGSGYRLVSGSEEADLWKLVPIGALWQWARVPVSGVLPGRRVQASAAYDSVRGETVVTGGGSEVPIDMTPPTLNPSPPVAYRPVLQRGSMQAICHAPTPTAACSSYTLEASVLLPDGAPASRARARFFRLGTVWSPITAGCAEAPDDAGIFRCELTALPDDGGFAVHLVDTGYTPGGASCSPDPDGNVPSCNEAGLHMGLLVCRPAPGFDGHVVECR
jgi:hypothetical protein